MLPKQSSAVPISRRPTRRGLLVTSLTCFASAALLLAAVLFPDIAINAALLLGLMLVVLSGLIGLPLIGFAAWEFIQDIREERKWK